MHPNAGQPIRFVLIGQDSRDAGNADIAGDGAENAGVHNADTTIAIIRHVCENQLDSSARPTPQPLHAAVCGLVNIPCCVHCQL